MQARFKLS